MKGLIAAASARLAVALALLAAGTLLSLQARAQTSPGIWTSATCSTCHLDPPNLAGLIDFADSTLLDTLAHFQARIGKATSNATMQAFSSNANVGTVYNYLVNVRDTVVTGSVSAFPQTNVGATSATTRDVTITNFRGEALAFTATLSNTSDYGLSSDCGASVAANTQCTLTVSFHPVQGVSTTRNGSLGITFTTGTTVVPPARSISLTGTVRPPVFSFVGLSTNFSTRVNQTLDVKIGSITNTGNATLNVTSIVQQAPLPSGATYTQLTSPVGACSTAPSLIKNASCDVWIRFLPTLRATTDSTWRFSHNASGSPQDVLLHGTGTQPIISPTSASLSFGGVQFGVPKPLTQTITNTGNEQLVFLADPNAAAALSGAQKDDFVVTGNCATGSPLAVLVGTCTLTVTFTPHGIGPRSATLTVSTNATNVAGGQFVVTLDGSGVALPEPIVTAPASDFPDTVIGETAAAQRQVTIQNDRVRDIVYNVADSADFKRAGDTCDPGRVVRGGTSCTVLFNFQPVLGAGEGRRQATLTFTFTGTNGDAAPTDKTAALAGKALLPITQSASALSPSAQVGSPITMTVILGNRSASAVPLTSLVFSGAAASDYSLDAANTCPNGGSLAAFASCSLVMRFDPAPVAPLIVPLSEPREAVLTINHGAPGSPQSVALHGTAVPAPQARIELSSQSLNFGQAQLDATPSQTITVNNGGSAPLTFSAFNIGGAQASDFSRSGTCSTATPLAIAQTCTLTISFHPGDLGARNATLAIASDATLPSATVALTGIGIPIPVPLVSFAPVSLDFGPQTLGGLYPKRRITLTNSGTANLLIASIVVLDARFANASTIACPSTLVPLASCDIDIRFTPAAANTDYTGTLQVTDNAAGSPHTVPLLGRGVATVVPVLEWQPAVTLLEFGQVSAGSISTAQTATLINRGPGGVNLTVLNAVGPDAATFSVTGDTCTIGAPLFEGDGCSVNVVFAPGNSGDKNAQVQVASTGSFPTVLALHGVGLGGPSPSLAASLTTLAFSGVRAGAQSAPAEITLTATGAGTVAVSALEISPSYTVQGKTCPSVPFTLIAGSQCTISVVFAPLNEGSVPGLLRITSDGSPAVVEVTLSGQADAKADVAGGGCSIARGDSPTDPTLWTLVWLAAAVLWMRRREAAAARRRIAPLSEDTRR